MSRGKPGEQFVITNTFIVREFMSICISGLFSGAISQSGTALSPWGLVENPADQAKEIAEGLDCPSDDNVRMVKCLKGLPAMKIARYHLGYIVSPL